MVMQKVYVVIPNWNGADDLPACLNSLLGQTAPGQIVVVDNASADKSVKIIEERYPQVKLIKNQRNKGFAGGVNPGIKFALKNDAKYVALLNNDALAQKNWLKNLVDFLDNNPKVGIATCKIIDASNNTFDSTGEQYTIWGLPFPRGRGETVSTRYDSDIFVFGASGGATIYRAKTLEQVGLFDEDFFAYYEDVDLSFRAQLAGWKVAFVPSAIVHHQIGATGGRIKNFYTYQTLKNLPLLLWKNVPWALMPKIWPRFLIAYTSFVGRALSRGQFGTLFKALIFGTVLWPKKMVQRNKIQRNRRVSTDYINSIIVQDLPPNANRLRRLFGKADA